MMQIAISGTEFCGAAGRATKLIGSNKLRVATVIAIGDLILFLGKLCVSFASAFFASLMLDTHRYKTSQHRVSSPLFPVLVSQEMNYGYQSNEPRNMNLSRKKICVLDMSMVLAHVGS
jgi:choline transporter-like protein 2/4/5